ncbi:MAG TPA: hypothetical protein VKA40_00810 [Nitrososphaera sp.]|jgi:hypothetical protein|nr:hypothetical protein [Nitrososphaera sp.]HKI09843.1 hypothetical protein [Nitrososphaeraceae archaeon]
MVASLEGWIDTAVRQNFEDMNRALKQRAENQLIIATSTMAISLFLVSELITVLT